MDLVDAANDFLQGYDPTVRIRGSVVLFDLVTGGGLQFRDTA